MKSRKKLTEKQPQKVTIKMELLELYDACMNNAHGLINEAKLLLDNKHYARAFFLALTSFEEIGKGQMVADYFNDCITEEEFGNSFRDHSIKMSYNNRYISIPTDSKEPARLEYHPKNSKAFVEARMSALYVHYKGKYIPSTPEQQVDKKLAQTMIRRVEEEISSINFALYLNQRIGSKGLFK